MRRIIRFLIRTLGILLVIAAIIGVDAYYIEPNLLRVKKFQLAMPDQANTNQSVKIVQISDIHYGIYYKEDKLAKLTNKVNAQNPDILVFTGDLFDNYAKSHGEQEVIDELSNMQANIGKYAIWGNRDYGGGAYRVYESIMEESGFMLLQNSGDLIDLPDGRQIYLAGLDDYLLGQPDGTKIVEQGKEADYRILLMHEPDMAVDWKKQGFDLLLAGHSHGGQINLPFMEGVSTAMARIYPKGLYNIDSGSQISSKKLASNTGILYVNAGIGMTRIPLRFLAPSEIAVFEIE